MLYCCCLVTNLCPTLCNYSLPGSSVHGILQTKILEWLAISSSRGSSRPRDRTWVSCVSCIGQRTSYHWATREAHIYVIPQDKFLNLNLVNQKKNFLLYCFNFHFFIYLCWAALGLRCCLRAFSRHSEWGLLSSCLRCTGLSRHWLLLWSTASRTHGLQ